MIFLVLIEGAGFLRASHIYIRLITRVSVEYDEIFHE